jgi:hypothetical protein
MESGHASGDYGGPDVPVLHNQPHFVYDDQSAELLNEQSATVTVPYGLSSGNVYIWASNAGGLSPTALRFTYDAGPQEKPLPCKVKTCM